MIKSNRLNVVQFVRDIANTGGGNIVINTTKKMKECCNTTLITDVPFNATDPDITVKIIPFGPYLFHWKAKNKLTRTLRHIIQIFNFNIMTFFIGIYYKWNGYLLVNNNNESLFGDVISIHNVFIAEMLNHPKGKIRGISRLLNPVMLVRVFKEIFILKWRKNVILIANSEQTKEEILKYINSKIRVVVITSGVDTEAFDIDTNYTFMQDAKFNVLFVGHEFDRKGLQFLLEALKLLPSSVYLQVVGGRGSNIDYFESVASKWGIKERVVFHGSQSNLKKFYQSADLFVLPSSYEGLPLVCLESMACGLPALLTCVGGMKALIKEGENGFFINRNGRDIADKISDFLGFKENIHSLKETTRQSVLKYSWENIANEYANVFLNFKK